MNFDTIDNKSSEKDYKKIAKEIDISSGWLLQKSSREHTIGFGDSISVDLPHHWQSEQGFEKYSGKVIYTKKIKINKNHGSRYFIKFNGIFYFTTVFFNDKEMPQVQGYFFPHIFEIPEQMLGKEITIKAVVESYEERSLRKKKYVTGIYGHWDAHEPDFNPGGIWQSVLLVEKGRVDVKSCLLTTEKIVSTQTGNQIYANLKLVTDCLTHEDVKVKIKISPLNFESNSFNIEKNITVKHGKHRVIKIPLQIENVELWYPHDIGFPHTYKVQIDFYCHNNIYDTKEFTYGFRAIRFKNWNIDINGRRIYSKGLNVGPLRFRLAHVKPHEWENEFKTLRELNCNMIRVHCHVQIKEFYEYADKYGIMIYQDFPLQWMYGKAVEKSALEQIQEMVVLLYNHPSIVLWSAHNEPFFIGRPEDMDKSNFWNVWEVTLYNYDKVILDRKLRAAARRIDKTRHTNRASSIYSIVGFKGTDIHAYWGWYFSEMTLFNFIRKIARRNFSFVSEFGTQSIPNFENAVKFMPEDIDNIDWEYLRLHHNCQTRLLQNYTPIQETDDLKTYINRTQDYQKRFMQYYVDVIRLVKNKPNAGILGFMYRSCHPGIDWSVVDYWGGRKKAFTTIRRAFQEIYPFIFINKNNILRNKKNRVDFFVVNDMPEKTVHLELFIRIKINKEEKIKHKIEITLPPSSGAVKVYTLKLDKIFNQGELSILLLAITGEKSYKNLYLFNCGENS